MKGVTGNWENALIFSELIWAELCTSPCHTDCLKYADISFLTSTVLIKPMVMKSWNQNRVEWRRVDCADVQAQDGIRGISCCFACQELALACLWLVNCLTRAATWHTHQHTHITVNTHAHTQAHTYIHTPAQPLFSRDLLCLKCFFTWHLTCTQRRVGCVLVCVCGGWGAVHPGLDIALHV